MIFFSFFKPDGGKGEPVYWRGDPVGPVGECDYSVLSPTGNARGRSHGRPRFLSSLCLTEGESEPRPLSISPFIYVFWLIFCLSQLVKTHSVKFEGFYHLQLCY